jgi:uncharacterized protein (TIGR03067 family)
MMKTKVLALLALALSAAPAAAQQDDAAKFQGTWAIESAMADGKEIPSEVFKTFKMTFKGDTYTVVMGQEKIEGTFRIDPAKDPKWIDIFPDSGPDRGKTQLSIYTFDGDKLKICGSMPGKERPSNFDTKDKPGQTLLILRKQP